MRLYQRTCVLAVLCVVPVVPQAQTVLFDTGEVISGSVNGSPKRAVKITLAYPTVINGLEHYGYSGYTTTFTLTLRADDEAGTIPGAVIYSASLPHTGSCCTAAWEGRQDLNWSVAAGTYWVAFETPSATERFFRPLGLSTDGTLPPAPMAEEAFVPVYDGDWLPAGGRTGWRIYGTQLTPVTAIAQLVQAVVNLNVTDGIGNALDSKLQNALDALDRARDGDVNSAIGMLQAFINSVEAQRGKALSDAEATMLVDQAKAIIAMLSAG